MAEHTVKSFDQDMASLKSVISRMGGLVEEQVHDAVQSIQRRDVAMAERVRATDNEVDALEHEVQVMGEKIIALRGPVASDLRGILGALSIVGDLERMGDYAKNVAKRATVLAVAPPTPAIGGVTHMAQLARTLIRDVLNAYVEDDAEAAGAVRLRDEEIDEIHTSLFRECLASMVEDPGNIEACAHLLFVAKNIERIGDHATNVAETVHFIVTGNRLTDNRPTSDDASTTTLAEAGAHPPEDTKS